MNKKTKFQDDCDYIYNELLNQRLIMAPAETVFIKLRSLILQRTGQGLSAKQQATLKQAFNLIVGIQLKYIPLKTGYQAIYRIIQNVLDPCSKQHPNYVDHIQDTIEQQFLF